jgi:hypothetical protein
MKNYLFLLTISIFISACMPFTRITTPEIMKPGEQALTVAIHKDAAFFDPYVDSWNYSLNKAGIGESGSYLPVIGYRMGSRKGGEWGFAIYPHWQDLPIPSTMVDYKHRILDFDRFLVSGNATVHMGLSQGLQYDLLIGNRKLYTQLGFNSQASLILFRETFSNHLVLGIGTELGKKHRVGIQLTSYTSMYTREGCCFSSVSLGARYSLHQKKRNF